MRFDGGSRGNPGIAGAGVALYDASNDQEVWSTHVLLDGKATNNEAEYTALISGLKGARDQGVTQITAEGDSQLVVRQVMGTYQVKSPNLKPLYERATRLMKQFDSCTVQHIPREMNARADSLANLAMDKMDRSR